MKKVLGLVFSSLFFVIAYSFAFSLNVSAYIDPSVMTYAIQAGAGIVIALGAGLGIYFRKMKKKINEKLGVDENQKVQRMCY